MMKNVLLTGFCNAHTKSELNVSNLQGDFLVALDNFIKRGVQCLRTQQSRELQFETKIVEERF